MFQVVARDSELVFFSWPTQNANWVKSRKWCFKGSHDTLNSFSASWPYQNATWVRSKKPCFKDPHGTLNLFSASGLAENGIWWSRKSDDSSCQMSLWSHFLLLDQLKMRLFFKSIKRRFKWQMALKSHFLPLDKLKIRLSWFRQSDVSSGWQSLGTHFLPLEKPKMRLGWSRKTDVWSGRQLLGDSYTSSWTTQNATCVKSRKRCFKGSHINLNHFPPLGQPKMRLGWGRTSDVSRACMALLTYFGPLD